MAFDSSNGVVVEIFPWIASKIWSPKRKRSLRWSQPLTSILIQRVLKQLPKIFTIIITIERIVSSQFLAQVRIIKKELFKCFEQSTFNLILKILEVGQNTVSTPISTRHPAEDSTLDYSYVNRGLNITPVNEKPRTETTFWPQDQ